MLSDKIWPKPGQKLVHKFRKQPGHVVAKVLEVDKKSGKVVVQMRNKIYPSLSAAAEATSGYASNGWVYWGLRKQERYT